MTLFWVGEFQNAQQGDPWQSCNREYHSWSYRPLSQLTKNHCGHCYHDYDHWYLPRKRSPRSALPITRSAIDHPWCGGRDVEVLDAWRWLVPGGDGVDGETNSDDNEDGDDARTCLPAREVSSKASLFDTMEKKSCSETGQSWVDDCCSYSVDGGFQNILYNIGIIHLV